MAFLTDRKRAMGMGAAKSGVHHFWAMKVSSVALLVLIPLFVFTFGPTLGGTHAEVTAYFARPFPAIIAAATIWVSMMHFKTGVQTLIEDYVHGLAQQVLIIATIILSYALAATGVFAVARIAL